MPKPASIPLIRQIEVSAVLAVLRESGAPIRKLLAAAKLPGHVEDSPDGFVSARTMLGFVGASAHSQDMPDLGWRAAIRARIEQLGGWGGPSPDAQRYAPPSVRSAGCTLGRSPSSSWA